MTTDLRESLAKAIRGPYPSTDSRPSYRAAEAVLPVVEAHVEPIRTANQELQNRIRLGHEGYKELEVELARQRRAYAELEQRYNDLVADNRELEEQLQELAVVPPENGVNPESDKGVSSYAEEHKQADGAPAGETGGIP